MREQRGHIHYLDIYVHILTSLVLDIVIEPTRFLKIGSVVAGGGFYSYYKLLN